MPVPIYDTRSRFDLLTRDVSGLFLDLHVHVYINYGCGFLATRRWMKHDHRNTRNKKKKIQYLEQYLELSQ